MTTATITVTGNLANVDDLKFDHSGRARLNFTVAHTPSKRLPDGTYEDTGDTQWYRCTVWGRPAEVWAELLVKGQVGPVTVSGRFVPSIFDGDKGPRLSLDVSVDSIGVREKRGAQSAGGYRNTGGNQHGHPNGGQADAWASDPAPF